MSAASNGKLTRPSDPRRDRKGAGEMRDGEETTPSVGCGSTGPLAYFITFTTYGSWLHGDERGSVDPAHNVPSTPVLDADPHRNGLDNRYFNHPGVTLDAPRRAVVHRTVSEVADYRGWTLHALNVRTNHVHVVIAADHAPERVMNTLKSWATRRMIEAGVLPAGVKAWTRHGSTRYLWRSTQVEAACQYVCEGQGAELNGNP